MVKARQGSCMVKDLGSDELSAFKAQANYVGGRQSIRDISFVGLEDESIQAYKERLLGNINTAVKTSIRAGGDIDKPFVEIIKIEMVCPDRPDGNIEMKLVDADGKKKV